MNLNDIFSEVFFTPDKELLDIPSDENVDRSTVTFFKSTNGRRAHIPFAQYAVLGDSPDVTRMEAAPNALKHFYVLAQGQVGDDSKESIRRRVWLHRGVDERRLVLRRQEAC